MWDQEWYSLLYRPEPTADPRSTNYNVKLELDLRHSDAEIVHQVGPFTIQTGGTFGTAGNPTSRRASRLVNLIDGYVLKEVFATVDQALNWQDQLEERIRIKLNALREQFLTVFPTFFEERHRRV